MTKKTTELADEWESPSLLYKLEDLIIKNIFGYFIYGKFANSLNVTGNQTILDFGCGSGAGSKFIARQIKNGSGKLICLDTSRYFTNVAKKRLKKFKNVSIINSNIETANFQPNSFDIISIHYVLHDTPVEKRNDIVAQFNNILKPTGQIFIKEPQRENDGMPVAEIRKLMSDNNLKELKAFEKNGVFTASYIKVK